MIRTISETQVKARKDHYCDASRWIYNAGNLRDFTFTFSEWRAIIKARNNGWKIKKGEAYTKQVNADNGDIWTCKMIPEIHTICTKYDYYADY